MAPAAAGMHAVGARPSRSRPGSTRGMARRGRWGGMAGGGIRVQAANTGGAPSGKMVGKARVLLEAIKFEHTIFALPFAYLGMVLAARATHGWPGWGKLIWISVAM